MEEKGSNRFVFLLNRSEKTQAILVDKQQLPGILVGEKYPGVRLDFALLRISLQLTIIINRRSKNCGFIDWLPLEYFEGLMNLMQRRCR